MNQQFGLFIVLQLLDLLTTLYFINHGGAEGNPIVIRIAALAPSFTFGLLVIKAWALALGYWLYYKGGYRFLLVTNIVFTLIVMWNIMGISLSWIRN